LFDDTFSPVWQRRPTHQKIYRARAETTEAATSALMELLGKIGHK
jgi:hypothetical protein